MPVIQTPDFNLEATVMSGQTFRWEKFGEYFYGVVKGRVYKCKQVGDSLGFSVYPEPERQSDHSQDEAAERAIRSYFRLDEDYKAIIASISSSRKDRYIKEAIKAHYGLRILRQDVWETLASFIISSNKNIPGIKRCINNICKMLGDKIVVDGLEFYTFPSPRKISNAGVCKMRECKLGFRAEYVWNLAKLFSEDTKAAATYKTGRSDRVRQRLVSLQGVGEKIADCVLLFALGFDYIVPFDVWMKRIFVQLYDLPEKTKTGDFRKFARNHFGKYAGWAHEFLYYYCRERVGKDKDVKAIFS